MYDGWGYEKSRPRKKAGLVLDTSGMRHLWDLLIKMYNR